MIVLVAGWLLMASSGGTGFHATMHAWSPIDIYATKRECERARDKSVADYSAFLAEPKRRGPGWISGRVVVGNQETGSMQFYAMRCEPF